VKEIMPSNFEIDEHGYLFLHNGWEVRVWTEQWQNQIDVSAPPLLREKHELYAFDDALHVRGESVGAWESSASTVAIPWPVLTAILAARSIVDARKLEQQ
jgi:hypothetical protein